MDAVLSDPNARLEKVSFDHCPIPMDPFDIPTDPEKMTSFDPEEQHEDCDVIFRREEYETYLRLLAKNDRAFDVNHWIYKEPDENGRP